MLQRGLVRGQSGTIIGVSTNPNNEDKNMNIDYTTNAFLIDTLNAMGVESPIIAELEAAGRWGSPSDSQMAVFETLTDED